MECGRLECEFQPALVLGGILLSALPLPARQAPPPAAIISSNLTANLALTVPDPAQTVKEKLAELEQGVAEAKSHADNAWMLVSAALVLMMTGPGLALFYCGLVRRKNNLAIMIQRLALISLVTVMWALVGYSVCVCGN